MKKILKAGVFIIIALLFSYEYSQYTQHNMTEEIAGKIIRFHVKANSDTALDQELKLKVRDAIGGYMQPIISKVSNIEEGRKVIKESLRDIEQQASQVVAAEGYSYEVNASLTVTDFPEKTYGNYTFPAGKYEALEVVIGKGKGHNWWCVMYPNLCFVNSTYEIAEEAEETLEQALTPEEYKSLMENKNYEIKFAWLDWLKEKFQIPFGCLHF